MSTGRRVSVASDLRSALVLMGRSRLPTSNPVGAAPPVTATGGLSIAPTTTMTTAVNRRAKGPPGPAFFEQSM